MENALTLIKRDHDEITEIFTELRRDLREDPMSTVEVRSCFHELKRALISHLNAEEEAVYSKLKTREVTSDYAYEGAAEHGIVLDLLEKMSHDAPLDEAWKAEFVLLKAEVERHFEEEEMDLSLMKKTFAADVLEEMGKDLKALKILVQDTAFSAPSGLKTTGTTRGARPDAPEIDRHAD